STELARSRGRSHDRPKTENAKTRKSENAKGIGKGRAPGHCLRLRAFAFSLFRVLNLRLRRRHMPGGGAEQSGPALLRANRKRNLHRCTAGVWRLSAKISATSAAASARSYRRTSLREPLK